MSTGARPIANIFANALRCFADQQDAQLVVCNDGRGGLEVRVESTSVESTGGGRLYYIGEVDYHEMGEFDYYEMGESQGIESLAALLRLLANGAEVRIAA